LYYVFHRIECVIYQRRKRIHWVQLCFAYFFILWLSLSSRALFCILHLFSFKTPTLWAVMSEKRGSSLRILNAQRCNKCKKKDMLHTIAYRQSHPTHLYHQINVDFNILIKNKIFLFAVNILYRMLWVLNIKIQRFLINNF